MDLGLAIRGDLEKIMAAETRATKLGVMSAFRIEATRAKDTLRQETQSAGLGRRIAFAWRARVFPEGGVLSLDASGLVFSNADRIIASHIEGATIGGKSGNFIAIPTPNAPKKGRDGKRIHPGNWPEQRYGPLIYVKTRRGAVLIVDQNRINKSGRVSRRLSNGGRTKTGRLKSGVASIVMFVYRRRVTLRKKNINPDRVERLALTRLPRTIVTEIERAADAIRT